MSGGGLIPLDDAPAPGRGTPVRWRRARANGESGAVLRLPLGEAIVVVPERARETGLRLWRVHVQVPHNAALNRSYLCLNRRAVRGLIASELDRLGWVWA